MPLAIGSSKSKMFQYYRTPTSFTSVIPPQIRAINDIPYIMVPSENSFAIYSLQSLQLHFLGPVFDTPVADAIYDSHKVFVAHQNAISIVNRGEVIFTQELREMQQIKKIVKFGDQMAVLGTHSELSFYTFHEQDIANTGAEDTAVDEFGNAVSPFNNVILTHQYELERASDDIIDILHPHTYINKILICHRSGAVDIFNINSKKIIFSFNLGMEIAALCQTGLLDIVAFMGTDGKIKIMNIKKNKTVLELDNYITKAGIKNDINNDTNNINIKDIKESCVKNCLLRSIDKYLLIIRNEELFMYDLETKKEIFMRERALSAAFINPEMFVVTSADAIEIYEIENLKVLKKREMMKETIRSIEKQDDRTMVLVGDSKIFRMSIYRDEQNCYLMRNAEIEKYDINGEILIYGKNGVFNIKNDGKKNFIVDRRFKWVRIYKEYFMGAYNERVMIMNLVSNRIVFEKQINFIDGVFNNEKIVLLDESHLRIFNYSGEETKAYRVAGDGGILSGMNPGTIKDTKLVLVDNLIVFKNSSTISVICGDKYKKYQGEEFCLDNSGKIMGVINSNVLSLIDVVSGEEIERIEMNKMLKSIVFMDDLKFIGLLDVCNEVHLLSNNSYFSNGKIAQLSGADASQVYMGSCSANASHKEDLDKNFKTDLESNFYKKMLLYKDNLKEMDMEIIIRGLGREELGEILLMIKNNLEKDFIKEQQILNGILRYRGMEIACDSSLNDIYRIIKEKYAELSEDYLKALSYLKLEEKNMLV
ncbi:U3 small nucleolar RNA-associated protein 21 [Enteropsectra breve]|nr:U3 small nucleolar RNA-associated protein 21 [Enteropsectra breve]